MKFIVPWFYQMRFLNIGFCIKNLLKITYMSNS